jgi:hypothetical protein
MPNEYVTIKLTANQEKQLRSIMGNAMQDRRNVLFLATAAPGDDGAWRLQVGRFPMTAYKKLMKLIAV